MKVSELTTDRIPQAVDLWEATGITRPWNDPFADAQRALDTTTSTVLAMIENEKILATVMVGHDGHRGWLYYLAVDPQRQGTGLGAKMVDTANAWLKARDVPKVLLMVRNENTAVRGFYERLGFEDQDVVVLGKRLDTGA